MAVALIVCMMLGSVMEVAVELLFLLVALLKKKFEKKLLPVFNA